MIEAHSSEPCLKPLPHTNKACYAPSNRRGAPGREGDEEEERRKGGGEACGGEMTVFGKEESFAGEASPTAKIVFT